jgi:hypothetical protein
MINKEELLESINEYIKIDISFVADLMNVAMGNLERYLKYQETHMEAFSWNALHDTFACISILKKKGINKGYASFFARTVYLLNPDGFCAKNAPAVQDNTKLFCDLYFPARNIEFEQRNDIDFSKLYEWWKEQKEVDSGHER